MTSSTRDSRLFRTVSHYFATMYTYIGLQFAAVSHSFTCLRSGPPATLAVAAVSPDVAGLSPDVADVAECCRASSHFQRPKSPSNLIRRYALNSLEVVLSVAEVSQRCRKVSPMSRWCRSDVAIVSPDVAAMSPDVAAMSPWCRQMSRWCRGGVASVAELSLGVVMTIF